MATSEEQHLPIEILQKAILNGDEYGWRRNDFVEVVEKATEVGLGISGGQVQFKLPEGTREMYWYNYDTTDKKPGENWKQYCKRTQDECLVQFEKLPSDDELIREGAERFDSLKERCRSELSDALIYILYFDDSETEQHR